MEYFARPNVREFSKENEVCVFYLLREYGDSPALSVFGLNFASFRFREKNSLREKREVKSDANLTTHTVSALPNKLGEKRLC